NPDMSDRAIAEKTGIGHATISRRRLSTVSDETVEPRVGRDGKHRRMPKKKEPSGPRIATTKPTTRKVTPPPPTVPLSQQANHVTGAISKFINDWLHTADTFCAAHPELSEDGRQSIFQSAAVSSDRLHEWAKAQTLHEIEVPEYNGQADVWERHVLEVGGATMALHASWTREFGAWETFPVTDEMISIADGAAQSWAAIANNFRQRKRSDD